MTTPRASAALVAALAIATLARAAPVAGPEIHDEIEVSAAPAIVYEALVDEARLRTVTGHGATMQRDAGAAFTLFDGRIAGRNVELVPNRRIVQAWRLERWPAGVYSIVRVELVAHPIEGIPQLEGKRIVLAHTGFPAENGEALAANWRTRYLEPLRKYAEFAAMVRFWGLL